MPVSKNLRGGLLAAGLIGLMATPAAAASREGCFWVNQWQGWSAPAPDVLYLKINQHEIFRIGLSGKSYMLQAPGMHLVSKVEGSSSICSPLDLDLQISDGHGFREPLIARTMTRLTPEEVAALPAKDRP